MKQYSSIIQVALCTALLTSCEKRESQSEIDPIRVETTVIEESSVNTGRTYSGVIEESSGSLLSFKIPGTIISLNVHEGQKVTKGQLIATLDGSSFQSNYEIASAALATTQDTYDRLKKLHEAKAITDMKWVEVENSLHAAKSACAIAKKSLEDTKLYAPFSGIISEKFADIGSNAAPAVPVVKLVEITPVKASISVPENEISGFLAGMEAEITVDAAKTDTIKGLLTERGVAADPLSRTYPVKFTVDNSDGSLLPGMLCSVSLLTDSETKAIAIPVETVLLDNNNRSFVWVVKDGNAVKQVIKLGAYTAGGVLVEDGLSAGDELITSGQQKVSEGMSVVSINH